MEHSIVPSDRRLVHVELSLGSISGYLSVFWDMQDCSMTLRAQGGVPRHVTRSLAVNYAIFFFSKRANLNVG